MCSFKTDIKFESCLAKVEQRSCDHFHAHSRVYTRVINNG